MEKRYAHRGKNSADLAETAESAKLFPRCLKRLRQAEAVRRAVYHRLLGLLFIINIWGHSQGKILSWFSVLG